MSLALVAGIAVGSTSTALAAPATPVTFATGSLIMPTGSAFQTDCGSSAVYGLVFDILRANAWLVAHGHTAITVHWVYLPTKNSPNRCIPSNLHTAPSPSTDVRWNDGCDFSVTNTTVEPVLEINNASPAVGNDTVITTMVGTNVIPTYPSKVLSHANGFNTVQYLGGPFVISAADAPTFLSLLSGAAGYTGVTDPNGVAVNFAPFATAGACTGFGSSSMSYYVHIHRASAPFTANDSAQVSQLPPRLALVDSGAGVSAGILPQYLINAGLNFTGAGGTVGGTTGTIYDSFADSDIAAGHLNDLDGSGNPKYKAVWTPHWDIGTSLTTTQQSYINQIAAFTATPGRGVVGECASIGMYEGTIESGNIKQDTDANGFMQTCLESSSGSGTCMAVQPAGLHGMERNTTSLSNYVPNCSDPNAVANSDCVYFPKPGSPMVQIGDWEWFIHGGTITSFRPNQVLQSGQQMIFRPNVAGMIGAVHRLNKTNFASDPGAQVEDWFGSYGPQAGDTSKGDVYYLGGHTYDSYVPGTRLILNTLFALDVIGNQPIVPASEVSRATPIVATVGASQTAVVQGTYLTTSAPPSTITSLGNIAGWKFPYITGHMRARLASSITTTQSAFTAGTILFDAAGNIPTVTTGGCATKNASCRNVFTVTDTPNALGIAWHPTMMQLNDGNASTIGPLIIPDTAMPGISVGTYWQTIIRTVLNGVLGGVDRSTVAVIGPSTVAGVGTRPTMAYFGGTDGMVHAVCATTGGTTPTQANICPALGKELWAFLPRSQLPLLPSNTQRIDGSMRVLDVFGNFTSSAANGTRRWRTILTFQTGFVGTSTGATYAIDITDPATPVVEWEYTTPSAPAVLDVGAGLTIAAGQSLMGGTMTNVEVLETNNGGTGGAGVVATAVQIENAKQLWQFGYAYPDPPRTIIGDAPLPASGVPGGAVGVDLTGAGYYSDVVFGDLYGDIWRLNIADGTSRNGSSTPLFSFSTNKHPFGTPPAIYANSSNPTVQFAAFASGGYDDPTALAWSTNTQYVIAAKLNSTAGTISETTTACTTCALTINTPLISGDKGFSQALVVGNQLFVTSDGADINAAVYGTTSTTGHLMTFDLTSTSSTTISIQSGASSLANSGTTLYTSAGTSQSQLSGTNGGAAINATSATGQTVDTANAPKISRNLWLRTQ